jgi:tetratricopeptide (TPR) repeat protein
MRNDTIKQNMNAHRVADPATLVGQGQERLLRGDYKGARGNFRLAILYDPRVSSTIALAYEGVLSSDNMNLHARLSLADIFLHQGDIDDAISELEEIIDIAPDRSEVYTMLGKLFLKNNEHDKAIEVMENAARSGIKDIGLSEMLAGAYVETGRMDEALSMYTTLLSSDQANIKYMRILGELYARTGRTDDSAKNYYKILSIDPTSILEVVYRLEDLVRKDPENIYLREILAESYIKAIKPAQAAAEFEYILSVNTGNIDRIIKKFREILDKYPDEPQTLRSLAKAFTIKGSYSEAVLEYSRMLKYGGQYVSEAIAGFKDVLSRYPGQVHAMEALGDAYLGLSRTEDALIQFKEMLKLDNSSAKNVIEKCKMMIKDAPNMILAHQVLGSAYVLVNDAPHAIEEAEFMTYLDRSDPIAHEIMGDAQLKMSMPKKAQTSYVAAMHAEPFNRTLHKKYENASNEVIAADIAVLKKRAEDDPWRLGVHLDLAKLYLLTKDFEKGIKELQTAVKDSSRAPFAHNILGITFVELGRFDLAVMQFETALDILPSELSDVSKNVRFNLGASHEAVGNVSKALSQYELILSEDMAYAGLKARCDKLMGINPDALRNKLIAVFAQDLGEKNIIGMWGPDLRHGEAEEEILNISFGQDHNNAGFDHFIKGRYKGAMEEFSLAVQLDPKFCPSLNNLAVMQMKDGHMEQAHTRLTHAISFDGASAVLKNNLGVYHYLKGELDAAIENFAKALEIDPDLSAAHLNMADVLYIKGDTKGAILLWDKIRSNDTLSPIAARRLSYKMARI